MKKQTDIFYSGEADSWYLRNKDSIEKRSEEDRIVQKIKEMEISPKRVLEIGCADGFRLSQFNSVFKAECYGIDPSLEAIKAGKDKYPNIHLSQADAAGMNFEPDFFDLIIFGFSLYLCERDDLFKIAYLADKSLKDLGHIVIYDFYSKIPYYNDYVHYEGVHSYKMKNTDLFLWNPYYSLIFDQVYNAAGKVWKNNDRNDMTALSVIKKIKHHSFVNNPYK